MQLRKGRTRWPHYKTPGYQNLKIWRLHRLFYFPTPTVFRVTGLGHAWLFLVFCCLEKRVWLITLNHIFWMPHLQAKQLFLVTRPLEFSKGFVWPARLCSRVGPTRHNYFLSLLICWVEVIKFQIHFQQWLWRYLANRIPTFIKSPRLRTMAKKLAKNVHALARAIYFHVNPIIKPLASDCQLCVFFPYHELAKDIATESQTLKMLELHVWRTGTIAGCGW